MSALGQRLHGRRNNRHHQSSGYLRDGKGRFPFFFEAISTWRPPRGILATIIWDRMARKRHRWRGFNAWKTSKKLFLLYAISSASKKERKGANILYCFLPLAGLAAILSGRETGAQGTYTTCMYCWIGWLFLIVLSFAVRYCLCGGRPFDSL